MARHFVTDPMLAECIGLPVLNAVIRLWCLGLPQKFHSNLGSTNSTYFVGDNWAIVWDVLVYYWPFTGNYQFKTVNEYSNLSFVLFLPIKLIVGFFCIYDFGKPLNPLFLTLHIPNYLN